MKYLIHIRPTIEAANRIEASGGPGPLFSYLNERLHPSAAYGSPTQREVWLVADIDDPAVLTELVLVAGRNAGVTPTFTPVVPLQEFGPIVAKAIEGLGKAPKVG